MEFINQYKLLNQNAFQIDEYRIVPIRYEDRMLIMQWRNEQMYHLRQARRLTEADQENYFQNVVAKLFDQEQPEQILFSYLEKEDCIGYGGLVHINWVDKNAEISFIINTNLEKAGFHKHWGIFLNLIEQVAFKELQLYKLYTYAFDLRPHLYAAIEAKGYEKEAVLKEHCFLGGLYKDVVIHSKIDRKITTRKAKKEDKQTTFLWANDAVVRENSFHTELIPYEIHSAWFEKKILDTNCDYYICEVDKKPAGWVRFDTQENHTTVGFLIDKEYRGKKLASTFLKNCCDEFRKKSVNTICAYIKKDNKASIKSFEKAGFLFSKEIEINGCKALKYQFDKRQQK